MFKELEGKKYSELGEYKPSLKPQQLDVSYLEKKIKSI